MPDDHLCRCLVRRDWPEEKIWDLITMGGTAMDPRDKDLVDSVLTVLDPEAQADAPAQGYIDPPETEEFLQVRWRIGRCDSFGIGCVPVGVAQNKGCLSGATLQGQ